MSARYQPVTPQRKDFSYYRASGLSFFGQLAQGAALYRKNSFPTALDVRVL
jgi:hypothetical protein